MHATRPTSVHAYINTRPPRDTAQFIAGFVTLGGYREYAKVDVVGGLLRVGVVRTASDTPCFEYLKTYKLEPGHPIMQHPGQR